MTEKNLVPESRTEKWIDLTYRGGVLLIVLLSGIYALSPVDAIPDVALGAGQIDDLAVLLSGGGSLAALTILRRMVMAIMKKPILRTGCLLVASITLLVMIGGALLAFYGLYQIINAL